MRCCAVGILLAVCDRYADLLDSYANQLSRPSHFEQTLELHIRA